MIVARNPKPVWATEYPKNKYRYFCSKECAKTNPVTNNNDRDVCGNCGKRFDEMDIGADPLKTNCAFCQKGIIADSSCAGVELGNESEIFYFCCQEHATLWGKQNSNGN